MTGAAVYRGRFAPSPTGPLHFGSLVAAVGSYLDARATGGEWLVRMEDLDPPREVPGAAEEILSTLQAFGFHWDGDVLFQSTRQGAYDEALGALEDAGILYPCTCSRREIAAANVEAGGSSGIYPGTCRDKRLPASTTPTRRLRVESTAVAFHDALQGLLDQELERDVGDFLVRRRDGLTAYQLAVVVDDAAQGITHVVRGCDLLDSTPRQIYIQQRLGLATPTYMHLPIAVTPAGEKLSKQTGALPLDPSRAAAMLHTALAFLRQNPPLSLASAPLETAWAWAREHWNPAALAGVETIPAPPP